MNNSAKYCVLPFWWLTVFSIVIAVCAYAIREVYQKWERSPVIVTFATSETPIYSIPFPAVTICPESKSRQSQYNHTDILLKLNSRELNPLNKIEYRNALYMSMICDFNYKLKTFGSNTFPEEIFDFLNASRREKFLFQCSWMGEPVNCDDIFVPIITEEGVCQTFNMLDRADLFKDNVEYYDNFLKSPIKNQLTWTLDNGYSKDDKLDTYPRRAMYAGVKNALSVSMRALKEDIDYTCKESLQGFKVILHTPMRIPRPSNDYFRVPLNGVVLGSIQPVMITTSDTVKLYSPRRRECYFPSERRLKYMKIYTERNCQMECLTNFTLNVCKCVSFYMPRENGTKICGAAKRNCMNLAEKWLQTKGLEIKLNELKADNETDHNENDNIQVPVCDCMPICTDLSYDVETSQADWGWNKKWEVLHPEMRLNDTHMSKLTLYFKNSQFITSRREELYGPTDFLANFGGLLGLFTGFSVLSVMEIIYFLTIRLFCNVRLYGAWYGPEQN